MTTPVWGEADLLEAFASSEFRPHPVDVLRPDFEQHVVGPLGHFSVVTTIDNHLPTYKDDLAGKAGDAIRRHVVAVAGDNQFDPHRHAMLMLRYLQTHISRSWADTPNLIPVVWPMLRPLQQAAAGRFNTFGGAGKHDFALVAMASTLQDAVSDTIHLRHPELGLEDVENLATFLRDPYTPSMFRGGIMLGGAAFAGAMRGIGHHPHTDDWRNNPEKPVLVGKCPHPRPTSDLRRAAIAHRANNIEVGQLGGVGSARRFSRGCASRMLVFNTVEPTLVANELSLTTGQVEALMSNDDPVVEAVDGSATHFKIRRDNVAAMCHFLAEGVDILARQP